MISSLLFTVFLVGAFALMLTAALAPIETLSWWAGWTEDEIEHPAAPPHRDGAERRYVVYLSGVASLSGRFLLPRETVFIRKLRSELPDATIISDVFPYSPSGAPLLETPRLFGQLWRRVQFFKLSERRTFLSVLTNLRNIYQVMVSADRRYGPIFNQGAAKVIEDALADAGYVRGSGAPVAIIGYSGGAQVAIGAAAFLRARIGAPIDVIGLGGVVASDPGLKYVRTYHHIMGDGDNIQRFGAVLFPDRWKAAAYSDWNAAKREGRIVKHVMPDMIHAGVKGYFGRPLVNGVSNGERTAKKIASLLSV
ncbi:hypothetical protein PUV54_11280 [Hyphococcus flavus]|uniref:Alpha/beta hydrolase n=1 Tax=Hyphococcus flavus TaxID=1866326 RepID=A0AAF0CF67_9PROT|nr:hypothetical protein [Hyphococcus flavus]WDI30538.1 hypothetical protein PUV54_11280 [Hyphococcus flavus]